MKTFVFTAATVFTLCGCATGPKPPTFKREYAAVESTDFKYEDKNILFTYVPVSFGSSVPVVFVNKSDKPIKIIWDEVTFINPSGQSEKIIHEGVRLMERNSPMPPSLIPPKASLADAVTPTSRIFWSGSSWDYLMICGSQNLVVFKGYEQKDEECVGKTFGHFVTYEVDGKKTTLVAKYKLTKRNQDPGLSYK